MLYGRGMPRPIAEVTPCAEEKNGILLGRGMPRPYSPCDSIAEATAIP